jgi:hypothetical protein
MCSGVSDWTCLQPGFPIRKSSNHSSVASSSRLIAGSYVLHRLLMPRHPPCALINLTTDYKDARVHCTVLKLRASPTPNPAPTRTRRAVHRGASPPPTPHPYRSRNRGASIQRSRAIARSLRTQQRARQTTTPSSLPLRHQAGSTNHERTTICPSRRSTHEQPPPGHSPGNWPWMPTTGTRRSLERR